MDAAERRMRRICRLFLVVAVATQPGCSGEAPHGNFTARTSTVRNGKGTAMKAERILSEFKRAEYWWSGKAAYAFWGGEELETYLELDSYDEPSEGQLRVLNALKAHDTDIRPYVESKLAEYYRKEIFLSMTHYSPERGEFGAEEITPPIRSDNEIWKLVDEPSVWIRSEDNPDQSKSIVFRLAYECRWDPEHGLGIELRDWKGVRFGGGVD